VLPFQTRLTQTQPVLPLSNEHGSQVRIKVDGSVAILSVKNFPIGLHVMYLYFPNTPRIIESCTTQSTIIVCYQFWLTSRPSSDVYRIYNLRETRRAVRTLISFISFPFHKHHKTSHKRCKIGGRNNCTLKTRILTIRISIKKVDSLKYSSWCVVQTAVSVSTVSESLVNMKVIQCSRELSICFNVWEHATFSRGKTLFFSIYQCFTTVSFVETI
jgi:hypothetical protein